MDLVALLLGRRLANRESGAHKIGTLEGVPATGLDSLASIAYGPEATLLALAPLGAAASASAGWLQAPVIVLLALLGFSYWQTIAVYGDRAGGAYAVARENLGTRAGLVAAAALLVDYILNAAVGISAGVAALVSLLPRLHGHALVICLAVLAFLTVLNLRGTLASGRVLAVPTWIFLACFAGLLGWGLWQVVVAGGHPQPVLAPAPLHAGTHGGAPWLLVLALAGGCTALTGVESASNSMTAFREPAIRHAHRSMVVTVVALAVMLACVAALLPAYRVGAMEQSRPGYRSVLAQLAAAIAGDGTFYYVTMATLLAVLVLSANSSFTAFPRLCRDLARDRLLPAAFANAGRRLVYSAGLLTLAVTAAVLLVIFGGITDRLIPLFEIGAFTGFVLNQFGMAAHWRRTRRTAGGHGGALAIALNVAGGAATAAVLGVIVVAHFREGAWIAVLVMAGFGALLHGIRGHHEARQRLEGDRAPVSPQSEPTPTVAIVAIERWNRPARAALEFAMTIANRVIALHVARLAGPDQDESPDLRRVWEADVEAPLAAAGRAPPTLRVVEARYRVLHRPILALVDELRREDADARIAVVLPARAERGWIRRLPGANRERRLRRRLARAGVPGLAIVSVPWRPPTG